MNGTETIQGTINMKSMKIEGNSSTKFIWKLERTGTNFSIEYSIVTKVNVDSTPIISKLCLTGKPYQIY